MTILYIILIVLGAALYRAGGIGKPFHTTYRDIGVPLVTLASMAVLGKYHWSLWLCMPLMWASMTTYWKCLNKLFGHTKDDCHWYNWAMHGFMMGLAFLPYGFYIKVIPIILIRAAMMGLLMMVWSELNANVDMEECGRGTIAAATIWMI